jgi:Coenzyme PQQ synthesis protein D (PqqD)
MPEENAQTIEKRPKIVDATVISRSPSVLTAEVDGEVVMMSIEQGRYFGLDDIGSDIWRRIEPPCSFAALIDRLACDYEADRATIAADVQVLLDRMAAQDVVRLG